MVAQQTRGNEVDKTVERPVKSIPRGAQCGKVCTGVERMWSDEDMGSTKCVQLCMRVYDSRRVQITRRVWR